MLPSILTLHFDLILGGLFFGLVGHEWASFRAGVMFKNVLGSIYIAEKLLFSMLPLILTLDFDHILEGILALGGLSGLLN